jgi:hypothetical protein
MAFNVPINSIAPIQGPSSWVRPPDWIPITDTANEVQFLVCDLGTKTFIIQTTFTRTSGNIYIDWGDGIIDTISSTSTTNTSHVYSVGGTPCSRGYNTWKIRIYGDATCIITNAKHITTLSNTGNNPFYSIGLLEAYFGNNTCNTNSLSFNYFTSLDTANLYSTFGLLEYVKLPATVSWVTQMASMFSNCVSLYVVIMPNSASALNNLSTTFLNCSVLENLIIPSNATLVQSMLQTFTGCSNLKTVFLPTTLNNCSTLQNAFQNCFSLQNVTLPSINLATTLTGMFQNCFSLQWARFTSLPSPVAPLTGVTATTLFQGCRVLQNVYFPNSCSTNALYVINSAFSGCSNLKNIVFPTGFNASNLFTIFQNCISLTNVVFPTSMPGLTNLGSAFSGCNLLRSVTLPTTVSSSISISSIFSNCGSLVSVIIPSGWIITDISGAFQQCHSLQSVSLPTGAQNTWTNMGNLFLNCYNLKSVILPTSLTGAISLSGTFQSCQSLESVSLPATMNNVTSMSQAFVNCFKLRSLTLPTSMSSCTTFQSAFQACYSLINLTMPATVSTSLSNYSSSFLNCINLTTLTMPTTQTTSLNNMSSMIEGCGYLTTINNLNNAGSLTASPQVNVSFGINTRANLLTSLSLRCPMSQFTFNATTAGTFNKLNSLRFLNTSAGQWTGTSPHINIINNDLSTAALNILFADIAAQGNVVSKTINITGCTGAAGLTAADRLVLTSRGWTITG